jgi:hypothetical protein
VLVIPVVLFKSAKLPKAVLPPPVVLLNNALAPQAVFSLPVVLLPSALYPNASLLSLLELARALNPIAVL